MTQTPSWHSLPADSVEATTLLVFAASLVCVCVALFGERLPALYLGIPAVCTLALAACLRLRRSSCAAKGFSLDDKARVIKPHDGRPIPFDMIASLRMVLYRDCACLHAAVGMLRRRKNLACVSRNGQEQDMLLALRERSFTVKISRNSFKKRTAELLPLIIMPLLAAALLYVNIDMLRQVPCLAQPPQQLNVKAFTGRANAKLHRMESFSFTLPKQYRLFSHREQVAVFYNPENGVRLTVSSGPALATVPRKAFLQRIAVLLGFGNDYEAAILAVRSRFGLMPAMIKSALLKHYDPDTVQIYHVNKDTLSGIMFRGEQARQAEDSLRTMPDQVAQIMLKRAGKDLVIRILITSRLPLATEHIGRLIAGIH